MSKKFSIARTEGAALRLAALLFCLLLVPAAAFAGEKEDTYKKAQAALNAGHTDEARKFYCRVAEIDPTYLDAKVNCAIYTNEYKKEQQRNEDRFNEGVRAFQAKDYQVAGQKFRNVTSSGPHYDEAQQYINKKIIDAINADQAQEGQESAMAQKLNDGVAAFDKGDFNTANGLLSQVTGKHQSEAQPYLAKMKNYQQAYSEGQSLENAKNYKGAISSYTEAANIKANGPGDPRGRIAAMNQLLASATPTNTGGGGTGGGTTPTGGGGGGRPSTAAIVEPSRPKIDVAKVLREAEAAKSKGDYATARQKYAIVLLEDPRNAQAVSGKASLPTENPAATGATAGAGQQASSEVDVILSKAIGEFYSGKYEDAEVHIKDYIDINGAKSALGYFYRGASKLTRYFLNGESQNDRKLYADAQEAFRRAKKTTGFTPPSEKYVSPKILKIYKDTV